jgi:Leucine-rich repeat (LRR) protein
MVRELDLSRRQLTSLPISLEDHADLEVLRLDDNALTMLPATLGSLTGLDASEFFADLLAERRD